ncbi:MAG: hypothetical protein RLZ98_1158 [Pseudomonadota bacterium]|jgi:putative flippase GtrA
MVADLPSFLRFLLVGGSATVVQYFLFIASVNLELGPTVVLSGASYLMAAIYNFFLTRSFAFRSQTEIGGAAMRFGFMVAIGLILNTIVMSMLLGTTLHYVACQVVATLAVIAWNYVVARNWVFPADRNDGNGRSMPS